MTWQHMFPLNEEHKLEGFDCECDPKIDWEDELVMHNSFDHREIIEEAKEILNGTPLP